MSITKRDTVHVALLARLELSETEKDVYTLQMDSILKYVEKLSCIKTEGIEPTTHAVPISKPLREDIIRESVTNDEALLNAPDRDTNCFKVPRIIE
ncbi:MAG: Asp-tRNA(Asn)/Glu-tRNA(Gln) amidotransferase subunit GatC [Deltaproteobacteria bacterium]|nr:Asp-tRNA(Asn)/Glu-tRNA(Gln) amidotransferase subunit GatC [Deltaproteobacteria bacterium]